MSPRSHQKPSSISTSIEELLLRSPSQPCLELNTDDDFLTGDNPRSPPKSKPPKKKRRRDKERSRPQTKRHRHTKRPPSIDRTVTHAKVEQKQEPARLASAVVVPDTRKANSHRQHSPIQWLREAEKPGDTITRHRPTSALVIQLENHTLHPASEPAATRYQFTSERRVTIVPEEAEQPSVPVEVRQEDDTTQHPIEADVDDPFPPPPAEANTSSSTRRAKRLSRAVRAAQNQTTKRKAWCHRYGFGGLIQLIVPKPGAANKFDATAFNEAVLRVAKAQYQTWYNCEPPAHLDLFAVGPPPPLPEPPRPRCPKEPTHCRCCHLTEDPKPVQPPGQSPLHLGNPPGRSRPTIRQSFPASHPHGRSRSPFERPSRPQEATPRQPLCPPKPSIRRGPSPVDYRAAFQRTDEWVSANANTRNVEYASTAAARPSNTDDTCSPVDPTTIEPRTYGEHKYLCRLRTEAARRLLSAPTDRPSNRPEPTRVLAKWTTYHTGQRPPPSTGRERQTHTATVSKPPEA